MKISVITATYNAEKCIPGLIESLENQTDKEFEWVVADGLSSDRTLEIVNATKDIDVKVISKPDFGIYDALNRAIKACNGQYYLVVGADDRLYPNAITDFKKALCEDFDIITASTISGNKVKSVRARPAWWAGQSAYITGHAVGTLFKKSLHDSAGLYSKTFPIAADQEFVLKAINNGARVKVIDSLVGEFSLEGVSSTDVLGSITESLRVNINQGFNKYLQVSIFIFRLIKKWRHI